MWLRTGPQAARGEWGGLRPPPLSAVFQDKLGDLRCAGACPRAASILVCDLEPLQSLCLLGLKQLFHTMRDLPSPPPVNLAEAARDPRGAKSSRGRRRVRAHVAQSLGSVGHC